MAICRIPPQRPIAYWNPKTELMSRDQLADLQFRKLKAMVAWAYHNSPFYERKYGETGFEPGDLKALDDITKLPFTTKQELSASQNAHPFFGEFASASPQKALRYHTTSGTTGGMPLRILDSRKDWEWISDAWCYGMYGFGLRENDIVFVAFSYGTFIGFWGAHCAAERIGCLTIPSGGGTSESRIRQIVELGTTAVVATPTYAIRLAQVAQEMGIDLATDSKVEMLIMAGEPGGNVPNTKKLIQESWGARAGDFPGLSESGGSTAYECSVQPGGVHLLEDHYFDEVIDPQTGNILEYGARGELVISSFGRGIMPMIRYRTGDLVERVKSDFCTCGRTFDLCRGGILGRADDMKIIRGVNVYPAAVENIVRRFKEVEEFQIVITEKRKLPQICVRIEPTAALDEAREAKLLGELQRALSAAHSGLRFDVELVGEGELPRFELKARRLIDRRAQWGG
jgi:phenylacetate-CoA ligase